MAPLFRVVRQQYLNGKEFRRRRLKKGISVEQVANFTGLNRTYVYLIEKGLRNAKGETASMMIAAIGGE